MAESRAEPGPPQLREIPPPVELANRYDVLLQNKLLIKVWIPTEQVGLIIGKGGTAVSHIRTNTGANVLVASSRPTGPEPVDESTLCWSKVTVTGNPVAAQKAYRMVAERVEEVDDVVAEFSIDKNKHHLIIGTKGITIRRLSAENNCRIHVPLAEEPSNLIELEGDVTNVLNCFVKILEVCHTSKSDSKDWRKDRTDAKVEATPAAPGTKRERAAPVPEEEVEKTFTCPMSKLDALRGEMYLKSFKSKSARAIQPLYDLIARRTSTTITLLTSVPEPERVATEEAASSQGQEGEGSAAEEPTKGEAAAADDDTAQFEEPHDDADDGSAEFVDAEGGYESEEGDAVNQSEDVPSSTPQVDGSSGVTEATNFTVDTSEPDADGVPAEEMLEFVIKGPKSKVALATDCLEQLATGHSEKVVLANFNQKRHPMAKRAPKGRGPQRRGPTSGEGDKKSPSQRRRKIPGNRAPPTSSI